MSKIEIINRALLKLGEAPISSLNEAAFGSSYEMIYQDVKKLLLSAYPWRFATTVKRLSRQDKMYGKRYVYPLPVDCLLLLKAGINLADVTGERLACPLDGYEIVEGGLVTDTPNGIVVEYVKAMDNDEAFPPLFREALAAKLAAELSMRLKHALNFKQVFDNEFYNLICQAQLNNEIVKSAESLDDNSWIKVRKCW